MAENPTPAQPNREKSPGPGSGTEKGDERKTPRIIVQGGAYYILLFGGREEELMKAISDAARKGYKCLQDGGTAVDAVEVSVRFLEDNKYFNAGRGSLLNNNSEVECDAMIMDGHTMDTGAVMAARHFLNPVSLSRQVMEKSHHCALAADGAREFAEKIGFPTCDPKELIEEETSLRKKFTYENFPKIVKYHFGGKHIQEIPYDTVSAVAMDQHGYLACATSTGGIPGKLKGRVGDAPLVGCGGYANEFGAATTGGHGEAIMKMTLAREVVFNMEKGQNAQESVDKAVERMKNRIGDGFGCAIAIDQEGNFGQATNSAVMIWATIKDDEVECGMKKKENIHRN